MYHAQHGSSGSSDAALPPPPPPLPDTGGGGEDGGGQEEGGKEDGARQREEEWGECSREKLLAILMDRQQEVRMGVWRGCGRRKGGGGGFDVMDGGCGIGCSDV